MKVKKTRGAVYHTTYHIVFCPKYRRKVLVGEIAEYLRGLFKSMIRKRGWELISLEVRPDHIHIFLEGVDPKYSPSDVVKYLKGVSGLALFRKFSKLREQFKNGRLWSRSYYVGTAGEVSAETIKRYIERVEHE